MAECEIYRFKALGITSTKKPFNTHLWWEMSNGDLLLVDSTSQTDLLISDDKGANWNTVSTGSFSGGKITRTQNIQMGWQDRDDDKIWFVDCDNDGVDNTFTVWYLTISTYILTEVDDKVETTAIYVYDINKRDGKIEVVLREVNFDNHRIRFYDVDQSPFTETYSVNLNTPWALTTMVVIGTTSYGVLDHSTNLRYLTFDGTIVQLKVVKLNYSLPASMNQWGHAYDNIDNLYFSGVRDADGLTYLIKYNISGNVISAGAEYNIALMLDRNNIGTIPNESEKAFGISNEIVYEITTRKGGILQLQDCSAITDANIIAITDTLFMNFDGDMFEYTNITSDINHLKVTEELGTLSYADMDIRETTLGHFSAGDIIKIYDSDTVLSWRGRILYPEMVLEGTEVIGKYVILGVDSIFDNIYRKNFTTVRSSDYIVKNIIDNALSRLFSYDVEIDDFSALTFKYDQKSKARKTLKYMAMLERAVLHYKPDGELFFNKYNNLSPNPQIYPATYDFEDETVGTSGTDIGFIDTNNTDSVEIVSDYLEHRKVIYFIDTNGGNFHNTFTPQTDGTIEYWCNNASAQDWYIILRRSSDDGDLVYVRYTSKTNIALTSGDGVGGNTITNVVVVADAWVHIRILFDCATDKWSCWVNGVLELDDQNFILDRTATTIYKLRINRADAFEGYLDAIGYSWDPAYNVGDNLNAWTQATSYVKITHYTPAGNRHITRAPVIGANNDLGQVYYVGSASESEEHRFGINELQPWRDPEITNYTEAKQLGDNLQTIYSLDTQMISMLVVKKKHIQVGYTIKLSWNILFNISLANFLVTKRVWYPITDICELELTDNILTRKAFNLMVINSFYDENAQEGYEHPDVPESAVDGIVLPLKSIAELRAFDAFASSVGLTLFLHQNASADVAGYKLLDSLFPDDAKTEVFNATVTVDDQEIEQWVTVSGGIDVVFLHHGVYHLHGHGYKFSGTKDLRLYFKVYIRTAGGAETLIGTSEESSILPDAEAEIEVHTEIHEQALNLTDRIVVKIFAHLEGVGSNPVMYFYVEGNTLTRFSLPIDESSIKAYVDANFLQPPIGYISMFSGAWVDNTTISGWYKCDGNNGTVNLVNKFVRGGATSGASGGSDDAVVVSHTHSISYDDAVGNDSSLLALGINYAGTGTIPSAGVSGTNKNIPAYYTLIYIQRIS